MGVAGRRIYVSGVGGLGRGCWAWGVGFRVSGSATWRQCATLQQHTPCELAARVCPSVSDWCSVSTVFGFAVLQP